LAKTKPFNGQVRAESVLAAKAKALAMQAKGTMQFIQTRKKKGKKLTLYFSRAPNSL